MSGIRSLRRGIYSSTRSGTPPVSYQTPTYVKNAQSTQVATPSVSINATAGNLLIAATRTNTASYATVTSSGWSLVLQDNGTTTGTWTSIYVKAANGGSESVAGSTQASSYRVSVLEYSGVSTTVDDFATVTSNTNVTTRSVSGVDAVAPSLLFAILHTGTGNHTLTGFTSTNLTTRMANVIGVSAGDTNVSAGSYGTTATWTTGRSAMLALLAIRAKTV